MKSSTLIVFRVVGAVLAVLSGAAVLLSFRYTDRLPYQSFLVYSLSAAALLMAITGWFLRTWWALLAVPVLFFVGLMSAFDYEAFTIGDRPIIISQWALWVGFAYSVYIYIYFVGPVIVGAAIGTGVAKWMDARGWFPRRQK
jgi:hypothetical protein